MIGAAFAIGDEPMAYISHSPFDYRLLRERAGHVSPALVMRSVAVAIVVTTVMLALSDTRAPAAVTSPPPLFKSDRLAPPSSRAAQEVATLLSDPARQTTTVSRGAVGGLSPDSPIAPSKSEFGEQNVAY